MTTIQDPDYRYAARVTNVVDGDTIDVDVDLGFRIVMNMRVRLYGVNTPERGQVGYAAAKQAVIDACLGRDVLIQSYLPADKYGRWLADVQIGLVSISQALIDGGLGVAYFGGTR